MKEIIKIIEKFKSLEPGVKCALATVVHVEGSSYRRVGARMLVTENGQWEGGISGGCLEGDALRKARMVIHSGKSRVVTYDTREDDASGIGIGLGCNGLIDVLICPIDRENPKNPIAILEACTKNRQAHVLITLINWKENKTLEGSMLSLEENADSFPFSKEIISPAVFRVKEKCRSEILELEQGEILLEYLPPKVHVYVFGGQYDSVSMLELIRFAGWESTLVCNIQKAPPAALSLADNRINKRESFSFPKTDNYTVALLMSHDYETDKQHLIRILRETDIQYVGLLGPKKRLVKIKNDIALSDADLQRIYGPVGLDTGATTPEEIAVSVVAEIRTFLSKRKGAFLRERVGEIHER